MNTIGIVGGSQKSTFSKIGRKNGLNILCHSGKERAGRKKEFKQIIKKSDCIVVLLGACGHVSMNNVKELCKKTNTHVEFIQGFGATGAVEKGKEWLDKQAS